MIRTTMIVLSVLTITAAVIFAGFSALHLPVRIELQLLKHQQALAESRKVIAIQPLGKFDSNLIQQVENQLVSKYHVRVVVKPELPLPKQAYYPKRSRYRAEKLLDYLETTDTTATKVLGLTTVDISTTKGIYPDWGILGQGQMNGRPCIVSTFRMCGTDRKVSEQVFRNRFAKVVAHEIGHTFGLEHCPTKACLMEDANGTVKTVDGENDFCGHCILKLHRAMSSP